jgi:hypothetical protein
VLLSYTAVYPQKRTVLCFSSPVFPVHPKLSFPPVRRPKTALLPVFLYGCETWSLTLRKERGLRRIFGPERDKVTGYWRRQHDEEINDVYSCQTFYGDG